MNWLNEPPEWSAEGKEIRLITGSKTDFWRKTHYGFIRDNGHFYYERIVGDFVAEVTFRGEYTALYDQAGLMVRVDEQTWLKTGIEFVDGVQNLSAVVTRDFSDWSVIPLDVAPSEVTLRISRHLNAFTIDFRLPGTDWRMLRLTYLADDPQTLVGPMAASPDGDGFRATFTDWRLEPRAG
jgi:uncharacterized protein